MPVPQKVIFFVGYILSATGKMPVPQKVIFFLMDRHYQHNFFEKRRQVRYDVISRSVLAGSSR
jgi:hypothetical protein